jgi:hypothetical protein
MSEGVSGGDQYAGIDLADLDIAAVGLALSLKKQRITHCPQPVKAPLDISGPLGEGRSDLLGIFGTGSLIDPLDVG